MTSKEFVLWLRGFSEGVHEYNITPKQWDILKDKLAEVNDDTSSRLLKDYINPYNNKYTTTSTAPYSTGGDDEYIKNKIDEN